MDNRRNGVERRNPRMGTDFRVLGLDLNAIREELADHMRQCDLMLTQYYKFELSRNHTLRSRALNELRKTNERLLSLVEGREKRYG